MQIRLFETKHELELLSASAAVLQDLGFQVEESVKEVGFLRATKERSAREYGQDLTRFFVWLATLGHLIMPVDLHQQIADFYALFYGPRPDGASVAALLGE